MDFWNNTTYFRARIFPVDASFIHAAHKGDVTRATQLIREHQVSFRALHSALRCAAEWGHVEMMQLCRDWGVIYFDRALELATLHGHLHAVRVLVEWNVPIDIEQALVSAARGGHLEILAACKEWGAQNFMSAAKAAAENQQYIACSLLAQWHNEDWDRKQKEIVPVKNADNTMVVHWEDVSRVKDKIV